MSVRPAGAAARHGARPAAGGAGLARPRGTLVLLSGDVPLLSAATLESLLAAHAAAGAAATVVTARPRRPARLRAHRPRRRADRADRRGARRLAGRTRDHARSTRASTRSIWRAVRGARQHRAGERAGRVLPHRSRRHLPAAGRAVETVDGGGPAGDSRHQQPRRPGEVEPIVRQQKNEELMAAGVTLVDPATTYIEADVTVGPDTVIHPNVHLEGRTRIGAACEMHCRRADRRRHHRRPRHRPQPHA